MCSDRERKVRASVPMVATFQPRLKGGAGDDSVEPGKGVPCLGAVSISGL